MARDERQSRCVFVRKSQRHFAAKTLRGAGNENVLTREFSHSVKLLLLLHFAIWQSAGNASKTVDAVPTDFAKKTSPNYPHADTDHRSIRQSKLSCFPAGRLGDLEMAVGAWWNKRELNQAYGLPQ